MSYLQFHLAFNLPALLVLLWLTRRRLQAAHWRWIAAICGIVLLTTTPWDNWAVYKKIWDFDWSRVTPVEATLGGVRWRLPAEEYAFFVVETIIVSLVTILLLPRPSVAASSSLSFAEESRHAELPASSPSASS